jgi:two-component system chemotaxis response regulator CheB
MEHAMIEAVVIGVSAGGLKALGVLLPALPSAFTPSIVVVQHRHAASDDYLVAYLNQRCALPAESVEDKKPMRPGTIYIAPANYHLLIECDKTFALTVDEPVNYARPSIDVLFESAADVFGSGLIGVVLTGANNDGSKGLVHIQNRGGLAIVQDPHDAEIDAMPRAAIASCDVDYIMPLTSIPQKLIQIVEGTSKKANG